MDNKELLQEVLARLERGEIQKSEIQEILNLIAPSENIRLKDQKAGWRNLDLTKVLYIIGAAIVLLGIVFFVGQLWDDMGSFGRIFVTFILGVVLVGTGSLLHQKQERVSLGNVFHAMGSILLLGGSFVVVDEMGLDVTAGVATFLFGALFVFHVLLALYHKSVLHSFFSVAYGTSFLYALIEFILPGYAYEHDAVYVYLTMLFGGSYLLLSRALRYTWNVALVGLLNFFGTLGFMGAMANRAWEGSGFWEVFYFLFLFGGVYLSIYLKSRAVLVVSVLFLIAHIIYITSNYFADSLGWPISLVFLGMVILGLAYFSVNLNKKYLQAGSSDTVL